MQEIEAKLALTQADIAYILNGGTLVIKIDGAAARVSVDLSCSRSPEDRRQRVRIKRVQVKQQPA
ncbi:hypothetical protein NKDENANG_01992 [Candidatus Entotheonellaceae bacterium PAL068K]